MSDDIFMAALEEHALNVIKDGQGNAPTVRKYMGTWAATESVDANLSQVVLQGGTWCRYVPKMAHVTGLTAGKTVLLESSPTVPLHIVGVLAGQIKSAVLSTSDTEAPTVPTSLAAGAMTTTTAPLTWTASTDNVAVTAYDIFVGGTYRQTSITTSATVTGLTPGTSYDFQVRARDAAGNVSGLTSVVTAVTTTATAPPPGTAYTKQYVATWSGTYRPTSLSTYDGNDVHQGQYNDGVNRRGLIGGFNTSTDGSSMATDLSGAAINACSIRLTFFHWYSNGGGTAVIGTHGHSSRPSTFSATTNRWQSGGWPRGSTRWVSLGAGVGDEFAAGTTKGISLGPGVSTSTSYYGKAYGAGSGVYVPLLQIEYTK